MNVEPAVIWAVILFAGAALLFALEVLIPSGGLLGLLAAGSAIGANIALFFYDGTAGLFGVMMTIILTPIAIALALKVFPHTPVGRRLILADSQQMGQTRYSSTGEDDYSELVGQQGVVVTELRPVGTCKIGDKRIECLSERGVLEAGQKVQVVAVQGIEVKVRAV